MVRTVGFKVRVIILLVVLPLVSWAQATTNADSLLSVANAPGKLPESVILLLTDQLPNYSDPGDRARIRSRISSSFLQTGQLDSAAAYAWSVLSLDHGLQSLNAQAYLNLGLVAYEKSAHERATDLLGRSLQLFQTLKDKQGQLTAWGFLARSASSQGLLVEAMQNYHQYIAIALELGDTTVLPTVALELSTVYRKLKRYAEAATYLTQAFEASRRQGDMTRLSLVLVERGKLNEAQGKISEARKDFGSSVRLAPNPEAKYQGYLGLLRICQSKGRLDSAKVYADSAEVAALTGGDALNLRECFRARYQLAELMRDTSRALIYHKRFAQYSDSVQWAEANQRVQNVRDELILGANEASIRTAELENELTFAVAQGEKQWQYFQFVLAGAAILAVLSIFLWFRIRGKIDRDLAVKEERIRELTVVKEKLFTVIAHDLQGPLSTYNNLTRSLAGRADKISAKELGEYFQNLNASSVELSRSLGMLLEWSLVQSGTMPFRPATFNCHQLVNEVVDQLRSFAEEREVEIAFLVPEPLHAFGDRAMVSMVLRNLLYNAIRFGPAQQTVTMFSGRKDELITLGVKDHGTGIPEEKQRRIFEWMGERTGIVEKGKGIGLPMCKELISRNGGNMYVESKLKEGTTIYFSLPENGKI